MVAERSANLVQTDLQREMGDPRLNILTKSGREEITNLVRSEIVTKREPFRHLNCFNGAVSIGPLSKPDSKEVVSLSIETRVSLRDLSAINLEYNYTSNVIAAICTRFSQQIAKKMVAKAKTNMQNVTLDELAGIQAKSWIVDLNLTGALQNGLPTDADIPRLPVKSYLPPDSVIVPLIDSGVVALAERCLGVFPRELKEGLASASMENMWVVCYQVTCEFQWMHDGIRGFNVDGIGPEVHAEFVGKAN